jgi:hypothetical protein
MLVSYTYSKTEDDIVAVGLHPSLNIRQPALSKSIDIPHIFSLSASYELPWGKSKALGGFTLSAITIFHSGDPLDVRVSASQLNTGGANWANQTCDPMANARARSRVVRHRLLRRPGAVPVRRLPDRERARPVRLQHRRVGLQAHRDRQDHARAARRRLQHLQQGALREPERDFRQCRLRDDQRHTADAARGAAGGALLF